MPRALLTIINNTQGPKVCQFQRNSGLGTKPYEEVSMFQLKPNKRRGKRKPFIGNSRRARGDPPIWLILLTETGIKSEKTGLHISNFAICMGVVAFLIAATLSAFIGSPWPATAAAVAAVLRSITIVLPKHLLGSHKNIHSLLTGTNNGPPTTDH